MGDREWPVNESALINDITAWLLRSKDVLEKR